MTRSLFSRLILLLVSLGVALGVGFFSAVMATRGVGLDGGFTSGPWSAALAVSTTSANPYAQVALIRRGLLPAGPAEGLVLIAETDSLGTMLDAGCAYRIEGAFPVSRGFTLSATRTDGALLSFAERSSAIRSDALVYGPAGQFRLTLSPQPAPGNWMAFAGSGRFLLVARLYDTALASGLHMASPPPLPDIHRIAGSCS